MNELNPTPKWSRRWLLAAGAYNLLWGTLTIAFPHLWFDLTGTPRINYPEIWQCVGMIVGVYGIGYLIAASAPRTHWPIVLVGLLGKIFGPIGFAGALWNETFPPAFGLTILTNDLIWWIPFTCILIDAALNPDRRLLDRTKCLRFTKESRLSATPEEVFEFHEGPGALQALTPPWEPMRVVTSDGSLQPGSRVVLEGRLLLFTIRWVAVHTEYDPPHLFTDEQVSGPFALWYHRHVIQADGEGGCILRDEVEYMLPMGLIGRWVGGALIRRKLESLFEFRHMMTRCIVEERHVLSTSAGRGLD